MWNLSYLIKDYFESKTFQEFINNRFRDDTKLVVSINAFKDVFKIINTDYAQFYFDDMFPSIEEVEHYYDYSDIRPSDIVLDIGACIGGFSLKLRDKVSHIYAVEPLFIDKLIRNIKLNNAKNITVLNCGLGNKDSEIGFGSCTERMVHCLSLSEIIKSCGGHVDFLKMDCEGGEWSILPEELKGIRRIKMEVHGTNEHDIKSYLKILDNAGFKYKYKVYNSVLMMVHAHR